MPACAVRCDNQLCRHHGVQRDVEYAQVGDGLYASPRLVCECGNVPRMLSRHVSPELAVSRPAETRTRRSRK